jgi:hypothetical protein
MWRQEALREREGPLEGRPGFRAQPRGPSGVDIRSLTASEEGTAMLIELAEELVHARPASEEEAKAALEWIAAREGKGLAELIEECRRHLAATR